MIEIELPQKASPGPPRLGFAADERDEDMVEDLKSLKGEGNENRDARPGFPKREERHAKAAAFQDSPLVKRTTASGNGWSRKARIQRSIG
jgi:hypothetical protein